MKYERITDKEHRFKKCAGCTYKNVNTATTSPITSVRAITALPN